MSQPASGDLPQPSLWLLTSTGLSALLWLWMPAALVRQVDALLTFMTPADLARDVALLAWLLLLPSLALALCGWLAGRFSARLSPRPQSQVWAAWSVVLVPIAFTCAWQLAGTALSWLNAVTGGEFNLGPSGRVFAGLFITAGLFVAWRRWGGALLVLRFIEAIVAMTPLTLTVLLAAGVALAMGPPRILGSTYPIASHSTAAARPPDVYLITIDALAAADAAVCGDGPTLMPRLRQFAGQATCFSHAYSTANFTTPATTSMETGVLPWTHWAVQIVAKTAAPYRPHTMARALRDAGFSTHSIIANILASPRHHSTDRAYDSERISDSPAIASKLPVALTKFPDASLPFWAVSIVPLLDTLDVYRLADRHPYEARLTYDAVPSTLAAAPRDKPKFLWVHTLPPHDPYLPPPSTKYRLLPGGALERWSELRRQGPYPAELQPLIDQHRLRYRESIMGADEALGMFLDALERDGRLADAIVIVSSDHGESFEHGFLGHTGKLLHDALLRIPLVIKLPGQSTGRIVDTPVSLVDLAPTVLDLVGAAALPRAEGRSLKPALLGQPLSAAPVFAMSMERQSRFHPISKGHYAAIDGKYKFVKHLAEQSSELFDLQRDPGELTDISTLQPEVAASLDARLQERLGLAETARKVLIGD